MLTLQDENHPAISADGRRIVSASEIGMTEVYDVATGRKLHTFRIPGSFGHDISADGRRVIVFAHVITGSDGRYYTSRTEARFFDVESGREIGRIDASIRQDGAVVGYLTTSNQGGGGGDYGSVSADLRFGVTSMLQLEPAPDTPGVLLGSLESQTLLRRFGQRNEVYDQWSQVKLTPDARVLAATRNNSRHPERRQTVVWDAQSGRELLRLPFSSRWLALSDDGRRLATERSQSEASGTAVLSVNPQGEARVDPAPRTARSSEPERSPVTEVWDVAIGRRIAEIGAGEGERPPMVRGALSPDARLLATASLNRVLVWDAATGRLLTSYLHDEADRDRVKTVAFSGDGRYLVMSSMNETVKVFLVADVLRMHR